jgi:hypothetical protein
MTGSRNTDLTSESSGFESQSARIATFALTNAAAASLAVVTLSLCLIVALTALSIKVMAATPIAF